jgi:hypothetical protein
MSARSEQSRSRAQRRKRAHLASASSANHSPQHFRLSTVCAPSRYHLSRASFGSGESWHRPGHRVCSSAATYGCGSGFGATKLVGRAGSESFSAADDDGSLAVVMLVVAEDAAEKAGGHRSEARKERTRATAREALDRWWIPARPAGDRVASVIKLTPRDSLYTRRTELDVLELRVFRHDGEGGCLQLLCARFQHVKSLVLLDRKGGYSRLSASKLKSVKSESA